MALRNQPRCVRAGERGSALLAVLGTVAALGCIAFTMAAAARGALDRAALRGDSAQAYFLACGGVEAALQAMAEVALRGSEPAAGTGWQYRFAAGSAEVRVESESGKLNLNRVGRPALERLLASAGATPLQAGPLADGIISYRRGLRNGRALRFGQPGRLPTSSFERRSASIRMIEELLSVPGITAAMVYGTYRTVPDADGEPAGLARVPGLRRYLRTTGSPAVDVNAAPLEVLLAAGVSEPLAAKLLAARREEALSSSHPLLRQAALESAETPLRAGGSDAGWTLTSTGITREPQARRTVAATVARDGGPGRLRIVRWFERPL